MKVVIEYNGFAENTMFGFEPWSGAVDTVKALSRADKLDEAWEYLESVFEWDEVTDTNINDYLWFESEEIFAAVGLDENGEEPEEDDDEWDDDEDEEDEEDD